MASACVNNVAPPMPSSSSSFGWFSSPVSFSRQDANYSKRTPPPFRMMSPVHEEEKPSSADLPEPESSTGGDFEFCLGHSSGAMLPADELFFDGKLLPLHLSVAKSTTTTHKAVASSEEVSPPRKSDTSSGGGSMDLHLSSPKAPRCSSRWKELLGFKKQHNNANSGSNNTESTTAAATMTSKAAASSNSKSIRRRLLHRSSKSTGSSTDSFLNLPLLKEDLDYYNGAAALLPPRLSLSSSSSSSSGSHDYDDLPRLSLDSDRPHSRSLHRNPTRMRQLNSRLENPRIAVVDSNNPAATTTRLAGRSQVVRRTPTEPAGVGITMDSPRMSSSGKVIFQSLERSSSSPSSFNGGPRSKQRGGCMERSYSAGVRVTPVLNVPVSSLLGSSSSSKPGGSAFGQLFSSTPQKRSESTANGTTGSRIHHQTRNRTDRKP